MADRGIAPEKIEELRATHGRIKHVVGEGGEWEAVLRVPSGPDAKMFKHQTHDPAVRADAQEILFRKIAVACWTEWGGECDAAKLLTELPLAPEGCGEAIAALTGMKAAERAKT
jgi:hypothetical protein